MANIKKAAADVKAQRYIILPRNQDTYEEKFAIANGRRLPFETPVSLRPNDIEALEQQKEPFQTTNEMTVYEAMEKFSVDQGKAAEIVKASQAHPEMNGSSIKWRSKYLLQAV